MQNGCELSTHAAAVRVYTVSTLEAASPLSQSQLSHLPQVTTVLTFVAIIPFIILHPK